MIDDASESVVVQQCLHGYSDGHRLLNGSVVLSDDAQAALLVLTDLPESVSPSEYAPFLTGYALPGSSYYALARTWHATEMRRPGCVWTHTLFIDFADLARIPHLDVLLTLHHRPTRLDSSGYASPCLLRFDTKPRYPIRVTDWLLRALVSALYGDPSAPTRVAAPNGPDLESTVLAIWSQQWPRLRRSFSFRTALPSASTQLSSRFDLEASDGSMDAHAISRPMSVAEHTQSAPEIDWLVRDLHEPGRLRQMLWFFGADAGGREACLPLVTVLRWLASPNTEKENTTAAMSVLINSFPQVELASRLKRSLFVASSGDSTLQPSDFHRLAALEYICSNEPHEALGVSANDIMQTVEDLWGTHHSQLIDLALRALAAAPTSFGAVLLDAVFQQMSPRDLIELSPSHPGLVYTFVARRPSLAADPQLWSAGAKVEDEMLRAIRRTTDLSDIDLEGLIDSILELGRSYLAEPIAQTFGPRFTLALLSVLSRRKEFPETWDDSWRRALASNAQALDEWVLIHGLPNSTVAAVAIPSLVKPDILLSRISSTQLQTITHDLVTAKRQEHRDVVALFVSFGLQHSAESADVVCIAFQPTYTAVQHSALSANITHRLDRTLPSLWPWGDWDICRRLCIALASRFLESDWDPRLLLIAATEAHTLRRVLKETADAKRGKRWVREFIEEWGDSPTASPEQRAVLRDF